MVSKVVEEAFRNILMTGKFPFFVINIEIAPGLVDVNVHPAKTEIKFANEKEVYGIVHSAVRNALYTPLESEKADVDLAKNHSDSYAPKFEAERPDRKIIKEFLGALAPDKERMHSGKISSFKEQSGVFDKLVDKAYESKLSENRISGTILPIGKENAEVLPREEEQLSLDLGESVEENLALSIKVIGQIFDTYIVAEQNDEMFLIERLTGVGIYCCVLAAVYLLLGMPLSQGVPTWHFPQP